jgi:integrase
MVRVEHQLSGKELVELKTLAARRAVPLAPAVVEELVRHREVCPASQLGLVFPTPNGYPVSPSNFYRRVFRPTARAAGLPETFKLHDLRKTCASLLVSQGRSAAFYQEVLGHSSAATTLAHYAGVLPVERQTAAEDMERWLSDTLGSTAVAPASLGDSDVPDVRSGMVH